MRKRRSASRSENRLRLPKQREKHEVQARWVSDYIPTEARAAFRPLLATGLKGFVSGGCRECTTRNIETRGREGLIGTARGECTQGNRNAVDSACENLRKNPKFFGKGVRIQTTKGRIQRTCLKATTTTLSGTGQRLYLFGSPLNVHALLLLQRHLVVLHRGWRCDTARTTGASPPAVQRKGGNRTEYDDDRHNHADDDGRVVARRGRRHWGVHGAGLRHA
jgi:hypothetical protein